MLFSYNKIGIRNEFIYYICCTIILFLLFGHYNLTDILLSLLGDTIAFACLTLTRFIPSKTVINNP